MGNSDTLTMSGVFKLSTLVLRRKLILVFDIGLDVVHLSMPTKHGLQNLFFRARWFMMAKFSIPSFTWANIPDAVQAWFTFPIFHRT